jgi:hypothetical protein
MRKDSSLQLPTQVLFHPKGMSAEPATFITRIAKVLTVIITEPRRCCFPDLIGNTHMFIVGESKVNHLLRSQLK